MAISEDEAKRLVDYLDNTVRELATEPETQGIINLLNQWRSDVEAGRPVERRLTVRESPGLDELADVPRTRTTTSGDFIGKKDYSTIEQLDMLVAALGIALIAPQMMATRFLGVIASSSTEKGLGESPYVNIHLVGVGDTGETEATPPISRASIAQSRAATTDLGRLLAEISKESELTWRRFSDEASF
ncbi:hypothetical protein FJ546_13290 [Mesorhizobium sp. B2-4-19]|uniref:hypothetical protein n=1 Tax=Mesorhizobium sp. B2-4-19 TaxID=2589930 RepID=UPI00112ED938|nr:hypothetical protein [Mesorhizobium sp. B2-4-19]TPK63693.1 hypothetical protein FJ546_13290 [Mesorhizobium sp. B2-4-19]